MIHPLLLELNTRCWLHELSVNIGQEVTLDSVPDAECAEWLGMGVTHIWLMGVWTTGPLSRRRALAHCSLRREFDRDLPGWKEEDIVGSPYAIARYDVPRALGGVEGLATFRRQLHDCGLKVVLDFVPNHVGMDHPWLETHPDYFIQSDAWHPHAFRRETQSGECWIAHGKDPQFAPWDDTAQLDYRSSDVHEAMLGELLRVAALCDGVRCDMAMLMLNDVFAETWAEVPPPDPKVATATSEFWGAAVQSVKAAHRGFLFLAEVYWGMEERLQALGFDYTYDKRLTDALLDQQAEDVVRHIHGRAAGVLSRSAHFLENHDEARIASVLSMEEHRAAALAVLALPGMRFLHDGQTSGATLHTPVQLGRRMHESVEPSIRAMYAKLFKALQIAGVGQGEWRVLQTQAAWADNPTWEHFLVIRWGNTDSRFALVIVNLSGHRSQCRVPLEGIHSEHGKWRLTDLLSDEQWTRSSSELQNPGLFLDVASHIAQVFLCQPENQHATR